MNNTYDDIRSRIPEPPTWWDENAVPRYGEFDHTKMADIYARTRALIRISCQNCGHQFDVARSWSYDSPKVKDAPFLHYGDPPNIQCCSSGPTMSSNSLRVLQLWQREVGHRWVRVPEMEVVMTDHPDYQHASPRWRSS